MARVIVPDQAVKLLDAGEYLYTVNGDAYVTRSVQGAEKTGPYWHGRAMIGGVWHKVSAGATIGGGEPSEWDIDDPNELIKALKKGENDGDNGKRK